jgi:hypothetical protein
VKIRCTGIHLAPVDSTVYRVTNSLSRWPAPVLLGAVIVGIALTWSVYAYDWSHWDAVSAPIREPADDENIDLLFVAGLAVVLPVFASGLAALSVLVAMRKPPAFVTALVALPFVVFCSGVLVLFPAGSGDDYLTGAVGWLSVPGGAGPVLTTVAGLLALVALAVTYPRR